MTATNDTNGTRSATAPAWMKELRAQFSSAVAHAFVLHFNTRDYVVGNAMLSQYLAKTMANYKVIARYNLADGITFALPAMREEFDKIVGLDKQPSDPVADQLAALTGSAAPSDPSGPAPLPRTPAAALSLLETLLRRGVAKSESGKVVGQAAVIIEYAESIAPNADLSTMSPDDRAVLVTLERWGADQELSRTGNIVFLITENVSDLHPALRRASSKFEIIEVPLPDRDERLAFIKMGLERNKLQLEWGLTAEELANATAMLSKVHIEDIFLRAGEDNGTVTRLLVKDRKRSIIRAEYGDVIEVMDPSFTFDDIGGLDEIKRFFKRSVIDPMRQGNTRRVPMGVLMTGPGGTGKSIMADAVAYESGMNCVALNPARLFGQYVGNTERNLEKALRAIVSMAPTIVFIDELDQAARRGTGASDGGSQTSDRFFKRLMEFMSDTTHRGKVLFLAATNRPDLIDAPMKRPGRFDKKVPFLVPNELNRAAIIKVMARRYVLGAVEPTQAMLDATKNWTGAEIEAAAVKALELVDDENLKPGEALEQALRRLRPSTGDIKQQTLLAIKECNDPDLMPPEYRERLEDRTELDKQIESFENTARARRE